MEDTEDSQELCSLWLRPFWKKSSSDSSSLLNSTFISSTFAFSYKRLYTSSHTVCMGLSLSHCCPFFAGWLKKFFHGHAHGSWQNLADFPQSQCFRHELKGGMSGCLGPVHLGLEAEYSFDPELFWPPRLLLVPRPPLCPPLPPLLPALLLLPRPLQYVTAATSWVASPGHIWWKPVSRRFWWDSGLTAATEIWADDLPWLYILSANFVISSKVSALNCICAIPCLTDVGRLRLHWPKINLWQQHPTSSWSQRSFTNFLASCDGRPLKTLPIARSNGSSSACIPWAGSDNLLKDFVKSKLSIIWTYRVRSLINDTF